MYIGQGTANKCDIIIFCYSRNGHELKLQTLNMPSQPQSTGQQGVFTQLTLAFLPSFVNKLDHIQSI